MGKINLITKLFFISLTFCNCYSQDTTRLLILDFQDISKNTTRFGSICKELPEILARQLNASEEMIIEADNYKNVRNSDSLMSQELAGISFMRMLESINNQFSNKYNYLIDGRFQYDDKSDQIRIEIYLFDKSGVQKRQFVDHRATNVKTDTAKTDKEKATYLIKNLASEIEYYLISKIVLGIVEFNMTNSDSAYKFLEQSIPSMLISSLADSRRFKIKEIKEIDTIDTSEQKRGFKRYLPDEKIGSLYRLNYLIRGEYFDLNGKIRIDARCISVANSEILISEETIFAAKDLDELSKNLNELATRMRIAIENDFNKKEPPPNSIAVVAFPPHPINRTTLLKSNYIRQTLLKKLRLVNDLSVRDNTELTELYLRKREEKFKICSDLGVKNLLSIEYYEIEDEPYNLDVDLFSIERPQLELYRGSYFSDSTSLDTYLDKVIDTTWKILGTSEPSKSEIEDITIPKYLNHWTLGFRGSNVKRTNENVYLSDGLGDYWELFLTFHLDNRWRFEIILGYDYGKKLKPPEGKEARVSSTQLGILTKFKIFNISSANFYAGAGPSGFLVYRGFENNFGNTEEYGKIEAGLITLLGIEIGIREIGLSLFIEPRYTFSLTTIDQRESPSGFIFPGGKLGGIYFTAGIGYNFNWPEWL